MTRACFRNVALATGLACLLGVAPASGQTIPPPFDVDFSFVDLGAVPGLPPPAGGLTFVPGNPGVLLIGGAANTFSGKIYSIGVVRDASQHVTGFSGMATLVANANGASGGIDGGLAFGPGGVLFYTSYSDNYLGQVEPGSSGPDRLIALTPLMVASSVGTLAFVPAGFPGAGRFKLVQYNSPGSWYDVSLAPDGAGTYSITGVTLVVSIGRGPEGIIYVAAGNPQFSNPSVLVSEYSAGTVGAYEIDANGDPVVATRRGFMTGLTGAEGAVIDPLTGDYLFSTFGGGNRVIVVRGFMPPTTSSTTPTTTSTTTTLPNGDCATEPVAATFASLNCRLAALLDAVRAAPDLGPLGTKVEQQVEKAKQRKEEAEGRCREGNLRRAKSVLKKGVRKLVQIGQTLGSRQARRSMPPALREAFRLAADGIQDDLQQLKRAVRCPEDAP